MQGKGRERNHRRDVPLARLPEVMGEAEAMGRGGGMGGAGLHD